MMKNEKGIMNYFEDWTTFELVWLILSSAVMVVLSFIWKDSAIALISGVTGIIGVVLCAKGKISTYLFATINVALYAYISYQNRLFGEVMLNAAYFLPMNAVGFFLWKNKKDDDGDVLTKKLSSKGLGILFTSLIVGILLYWKVLNMLNGNLQLIDSITTVSSVIALILQVLRYKEQWLIWIIVNIVSVGMWALLLNTPDGSITMIVMWAAYLVNSIYGYVNWTKLNKQQKAAA